MMRRISLLIGLFVFGLNSSSLPAVEPVPDFTRDVRPILAEHCFKCHGPDDRSRKGSLRLDRRDDAIAAVIVPGKPEQSELLRRLHAEDESELMPPPSTKKPLTDAKKQTLRFWIANGAPYQEHWAFLPIRRPAVPGDGQAHPVDAFIRTHLQRVGLQPSQPASKYELIRRVSLDLIGLPPTAREIEEYVQDTSPQAYERLVDRLLASPHYGERWARKWLDLARYADTNGYEKDRPRSIWPYRDWVIRAFNNDLPFDEFTIQQIAGDMLPDATIDQRIATGFHRNTMVNEEGGVDPQEFRYYAVVDRVNTTGTTWLGLTTGCAQCHTHKFDPIPQVDYYRMLACLNNTSEPELEVPSPEIQAQQADYDQKIRELERKLKQTEQSPGFNWKFLAWRIAERKRSTHWTVLRPTSTDAGPLTRLHALPDGSLLATGDPTKADVYRLKFDSIPAGVTALRVEALPHPSLPAQGPGRSYYEGPKGDFLLSDLRLFQNGQPRLFSDASESYAKLGLIAKESSARLALDNNLQTGWAASGREGQASHAIFRLAGPTLAPASGELKLTFERHYPASLGRFRISITTDPSPGPARDLPVEVEALLLREESELRAEDRQRLREAYQNVAREYEPLRTAIQELRKARPKFPTTLVMSERPAVHPRKTFVHTRGEFLQPAQEVKPGTLSILPGPKEPLNRLEFARWLVSEQNPLTARVIMNRTWEAFFGRGIVKTSEDFGYQGSPPSHPDLLDWLASEFMRPADGKHAWSLKRMHRLIVMSETYRQSSHVRPEQLEKDPENVFLSRSPRIRLEAEMVRDSALRVSGLLSSKIGGPSVFPPQPPGVTTEGAYGKLDWKVSKGEDRYRRGLYTFAKRTTPYAMFATFDAPSGEACIARREVTNTPLQALTMLNDSVILESAQALAKQFVELQEPTATRVSRLILQCLCRPATRGEIQSLTNFYETQHQYFSEHRKQAEALAGIKEGDVVARASWTAVARIVLNLDEFITRE